MNPDNFPAQALHLGPCHGPFTPLGKQKPSQVRALPKFQGQGQWKGGLGSTLFLTPSPAELSQPARPDLLAHPPWGLGSDPRPSAESRMGTGLRGYSLKGAGPLAEVQGKLSILVGDVGVRSCHQQHVDAGGVACSTGFVQGGAARRGTVRPCPPPQQQPKDFCVAPAGSHVQGCGQLLFVCQRPES